MLKNLRLNDINPNIVCTLCNGYFIDPVTLVECLHSFCKTCIVKYVKTNKACPICLVQIHKTRPLLSMKSDKILQNIVFKLVPNLYIDEMNRRKKFQELHEPTKVSREELEKHFFFRDDRISMSIEYYDNSKESHPEQNLQNRRYLDCPGTVKVQHLKKFIITKYGLTNIFVIDIIYMGDIIPDDYTLIDVAYYYDWKKDSPMRFFYRIFKKTRMYLKRKRSRLDSKGEIVDTDKEPNTKQAKVEKNSSVSTIKPEKYIQSGIKPLKPTLEKETSSTNPLLSENDFLKNQEALSSNSPETKVKKANIVEQIPSENKSGSQSQRNTLTVTSATTSNQKPASPSKSPNKSENIKPTPTTVSREIRGKSEISTREQASFTDEKLKQNKQQVSGDQILSVINNLAKKQMDRVACINKEPDPELQQPWASSNSPPPLAIFSAALQLQYAVKPAPATASSSPPSNGTPVMVSPNLKSSSPPNSTVSNVTILSPTEKSKQTLNELRQFRKTSTDHSPTKSSSPAIQLNLTSPTKSPPSSLVSKLIEAAASSSRKLLTNTNTDSEKTSDTIGSASSKSSPSDLKKIKPSSPTSTSASNKQHAQLPSNRLQLKMQQSSPVSNFQSAFQSTIYSQLAAETLWKHQQAANAAVLQANMQALAAGNLSKTLNQNVRQIPNPSLLAKQQKDLLIAMAAAAAIRSSGDPHQNGDR